MKLLSKNSFNKANQAIKIYGRPLEQCIFDNYFLNGEKKNILNELKKYQNEDGGFGHGIESDFRLPYSSPMATSVGVRHLSKIDDTDEAREIIKLAIGYFEESFDKERNGWFVASREINNFPHAPWWNYNEDEGMTIIDRNWGNPSAEIAAYLYKYREFLQDLDVDKLVEFAINHLEKKEKFDSEIEIFCYIRLYEVLSENLQERLEKRIKVAISQVIEYDREKWTEYVPKPVEFVVCPERSKFGVDEVKIEENLDFLAEQIDNYGKINPPWGQSFYLEDLKPAYNEWIGVLTLNALITLSKYGRIDE